MSVCEKTTKEYEKTFLGVIVQKARFIKKKAKRKVEKEGEIVYDRHTK